MWCRTLAIAAVLTAACSGSPTAPSPVATSPPIPPEALLVEGTWQGTYRIARANPANCGIAIGCGETGTVRLTLARSGDDLSGTLDAGIAGRFAVKGRVTSGPVVTLLSDPVTIVIPCTGRPTATGESLLLNWNTQLIGGKTLVGTFTSQDFRPFNVGGTNLCPSGAVVVVADEVRLTRVPPP